MRLTRYFRSHTKQVRLTRVEATLRELTIASSLPPTHPTYLKAKTAFDIALNDDIEFRASRTRISTDVARELPTKFLSSLLHQTKTRNYIHFINHNKQHLHTTSDIIQVFHTFYSDLYTENHVSDTSLKNHCLTFPLELQRALSNPPTPHDLLAPILNKRKKSPGPDGLPTEIYTQYPILTMLLCKVVSHVWATGEVPPSWLLSFTHLILKDGKDPTLITNYRGIAFCNTDYKQVATSRPQHCWNPSKTSQCHNDHTNQQHNTAYRQQHTLTSDT